MSTARRAARRVVDHQRSAVDPGVAGIGIRARQLQLALGQRQRSGPRDHAANMAGSRSRDFQELRVGIHIGYEHAACAHIPILRIAQRQRGVENLRVGVVVHQATASDRERACSDKAESITRRGGGLEVQAAQVGGGIDRHLTAIARRGSVEKDILIRRSGGGCTQTPSPPVADAGARLTHPRIRIVAHDTQGITARIHHRVGGRHGRGGCQEAQIVVPVDRVNRAVQPEHGELGAPVGIRPSIQHWRTGIAHLQLDRRPCRADGDLLRVGIERPDRIHRGDTHPRASGAAGAAASIEQEGEAAVIRKRVTRGDGMQVQHPVARHRAGRSHRAAQRADRQVIVGVAEVRQLQPLPQVTDGADVRLRAHRARCIQHPDALGQLIGGCILVMLGRQEMHRAQHRKALVTAAGIGGGAPADARPIITRADKRRAGGLDGRIREPRTETVIDGGGITRDGHRRSRNGGKER